MQNAEVHALESSKAARKRSGIIICRDRAAYIAIDGAYFKHEERAMAKPLNKHAVETK